MDSMLSKLHGVSGELDAALHVIFEVNRLLRDEGERIARAAGQTNSRRLVLQAAAAAAVTVADIARQLGLQRQSVQRVADDLVEEGLAEYEVNPRHRVSRLLIPTSKGRGALDAIGRAHQTWLEDLDQGVGQFDWAALNTDLQRIADAVRHMDSNQNPPA
jgi:DNA-binding MarR family transcriptional regulator